MRISSIQPNLVKTNYVKNNLKNDGAVTKPQPVNPQFRGGGNGALLGAAGGVVTGLLGLGAAAIAGVFVAPAIVATAVIGGSAVIGGKVGDKIEDKIDEIKSNW